MSDYVVQMKGIHKSFGSNEVLHGVDLSLKQGEIHALLGENGTGKSTLMNILGGVLHANAGEIYIDGSKAEINSPSEAIEKGIAFIHQELTLVNDLYVYENLFLGQELHKHGYLDKKSMLQKAKEVLAQMQVELDPMTMVRELNASFKQIIEIARALLKNARVIIMDEPTTSLTDVEIQHVFQIMRGLQDQGVSFVFISHKLNEVVEICNSYTVMRDGNVVSSQDTMDGVTEAILAKYMVGKELSYDSLYRARPLGEVILETRELTREHEFRNVSFHVNKGEIVGITGLLGDGRSDVLATVFGCNNQYGGEIHVNGKKHSMHSTTRAKALGISYVPRNRKENGIVKDLSVAENMSLSILEQFRKLGLINAKKETESNTHYVQQLNIKVEDLDDPITSLSGGNQQKAVLAKALGSTPQIVILDNPTQGVDVGAKLEIYGIIMSLAEQGVSFVVLSSEAQEVLMLCDRIYVMFHGEIKEEFCREEATEENIMLVATGGTLSRGDTLS